MIRYEDRCCGCATESYPCIGSACSLRNVEVHYCDYCKCELDEIYNVDGDELCEDCLKDLFRR